MGRRERLQLLAAMAVMVVCIAASLWLCVGPPGQEDSAYVLAGAALAGVSAYTLMNLIDLWRRP